MTEFVMAGLGGAVMLTLVYIVHMLRQQHLAMNSKFDLLLKTTGDLRRAEGFKAGQEEHLAAIRGEKE